MYVQTHAPRNYKCPFCAILDGVEGDFPYTKQFDIFYRNKLVTAFISSHWWPNNPGNVIIIPNKHIENIYRLPDEYNCAVQKAVKEIAMAIRQTYKCEGTSVRQHNEPAGNQDVWHYHVQVFSRYNNDHLYEDYQKRTLVKPEKRRKYSSLLSEYFSKR